MEMKVIFAGAMFLVGWLWFYLFFRQFLFNILVAFPMIKAMNKAQTDLIAIGAKRYTIVSLIACTVVCAIVAGIIIWLCPLYLIISFLVGALLSKKVSLGSVCGAIACGVGCLLLVSSVPRLILGLFSMVVVVVRHKENIRRLIKGTEPDFKPAKRKAGAQPENQ